MNQLFSTPEWPAWNRLLNSILDDAIQGGCDEERVRRGIELAADFDALQRAVWKYGTRVDKDLSKEECHCFEKKFHPHLKRCKHQIALLVAQRLMKRLTLKVPEEPKGWKNLSEEDQQLMWAASSIGEFRNGHEE